MKGFCDWRIGLALLLPTLLFSAAAPYSSAPGLSISPDYTLTADGRDIPVRHTPAFSYANFTLNGDTNIVVHAMRPIITPVIRPLSLGITPTKKDATVSFRLRQPAKVALEIDGDTRRPLFIFADAPETVRPIKSTSTFRYFEGGKIHDVGRIDMNDGQTVYLAGGAIVRGVIRANKAKGIRILGPGVLDASQREQESKTIDLRDCRDVEMSDFMVLGSRGWSITTHLCEQVHVRNLKVLGWRDNDDGFDPDSCRHVRLEHCFFRTKDDCIAVKAHGRFGLIPAGGEGNSDAFSTEDVVVTDSTFWSSQWGHALTVGFAVSGPAIRDVTFRNCDIIKKEKGPAMSIDNHDLGTVEKVVFENIRVEPGCDQLTAVKVAFSEYSADCPPRFFRNNPKRERAEGAAWEAVLAEKRASPRGRIRDVVFRAIRINGDRLPPSSIIGPENLSIQGVTYENIEWEGKPLRDSESLNLRVRNADKVEVK